MKRLISLIFIFLCTMPGLSYGDEFYETQLDKGIRNSENYSLYLIKKARENGSDAMALLKSAATASPDLPVAYFELSKESLSLSPGSVFSSIDYLFQGIGAYFRNFWWSFTLTGSLFFSIFFSFIAAIILVIFIGLINNIALISHDIQETHSKAVFMPVLVGLSIISPLFLLAGILVMLGFYMRKIDRAVVYLFLVFMLFSPLIFKTASVFIGALSSGKTKAVIQVNESKGNNYAISVLKDSDDYDGMFAYALALKRAGFYDEAISVYSNLIKRKPDAKAYVNLADSYVGLNNFDEAVRFYQMSIDLEPRASAYYNMSQVSRELLDFKKGNEYFMSAVSIDREAVAAYRSIYGRSPNRLVVDEPLNRDKLWEYILQKSGKASSFGLTGIPVSALPVVALILIIIFFISDRKMKDRAARCKRCNAILCSKCEKHLMWGQMCPECYRSLVKLDELDVKERAAKLHFIYTHQKKQRDTMKVLSFVLPGLPHIYAGRIFSGFALLWSFLFFLFIPVTNVLFFDSAVVSHGFVNWIALLILVAFYVISNIKTRQRITSGWL